ncbi:large ribosomal subunit protein mL40 [Hydra vulgaris]|uniref:large ribosomal subunit protein mL40 n=1 Tax=Hydra vulgaris TaxID=6087 RepID=UPI0002B4A0CB|nr:39S ribosomal protein L40, mitochondrial [Hydra vulgaris]
MSIKRVINTAVTSTTVNNVRLFMTTTKLNHSPNLKKKQAPQLDQKKLQRQKELEEAKLRKQIITPPIDPDSVPHPFWFNADRQRQSAILSEKELEERDLILKDWSRLQMNNHMACLQSIKIKVKCRTNALQELKKESEFLYNQAILVDRQMFPLTLVGPVETPPLDGYEAPDFVTEKK